MDEAWSAFELSGRVTDYLNFKRAEKEHMRSAVTAEPQKERPDGTEYHGDRYGLKGDADWRL